MKGLPTRPSSHQNKTKLSKALTNHLAVIQSKKMNRWPKLTKVVTSEKSFVLGDYPLDLKENKK